MALCISSSSVVFSRQLQASRPQRLRSVAVRAEGGKINATIRLDEAKVVDNITADSTKPVAYCRCWKSSTFPKCDGSHVAHNKEVGDNVGPLLVKKDA